jgi:hypothetical protein
MRCYIWIFAVALAWSVSGAEIQFNFGDQPLDATPTNFTPVLVGGGKPGVWKIVPAEVPSSFGQFAGEAPTMNRQGVLAQTSEDMTDEHFPLLIYTNQTFRNFTFSTRLKTVSGIAEQMAGLVFRYQNPSNYYVVRMSALGNNVRFYKVVDGLRSVPIGPSLAVTNGAWHTLAVQCDGNQIALRFDGKPVMPPLGDNSFNEGRIGFCTKSDAVAYFTAAKIEYTPVIAAAQSLVNQIMARQTRLLGLRVYLAQTNGTTRVVASNLPREVGLAGTPAELNAIKDGTVSFGREDGAVLVTLPLHDRNGDFIAAVRVRLKSFWGETQDNALARARQIVKQIQAQVLSKNDLL